MDRFVLKRSRTDRPGVADTSKRTRSDEWGAAGDPKSIVAWNCNGLPVRLSKTDDRCKLLSFMREHKPDVLCLSEVRAAALTDGAQHLRGQFGTSKNGAADKAAVDKLMSESAFAGYKAYFSLADSKYAGSAVLLNRAELDRPVSVHFNLNYDELSVSAKQHDENGRIIVVEVRGCSCSPECRGVAVFC
jgi:exonuclease III